MYPLLVNTFYHNQSQVFGRLLEQWTQLFIFISFSDKYQFVLNGFYIVRCSSYKPQNMSCLVSKDSSSWIASSHLGQSRQWVSGPNGGTFLGAIGFVGSRHTATDRWFFFLGFIPFSIFECFGRHSWHLSTCISVRGVV